MQAIMSPPSLRPSDFYLNSIEPDEFDERNYLISVAEDYGFSVAELHQVLSTKEGRKQACKTRFLLWTLLFARDHLTIKEGKNAGKVTMSTLSLEIFREAEYLLQKNTEPEDRRLMEIAPRSSGKSTILAILIPTYLMCIVGQGYKDIGTEFVCLFTQSHEKAKQRMKGCQTILSNENLLTTYPHVRQIRRNEQETTANSIVMRFRSGSVLHCSSITSGSISGLLEGGLRPTLIVLDDVSPSGGTWSMNTDMKVLATIRNVIYGLSRYARIFWVGTTTAYMSLCHQALISKSEQDDKSWALVDKWDIRHHPPLVRDHNGQERSFWEAQYSTEYIQSVRDENPRLFALDWENSPMAASEGEWWTEDLFVHVPLQSHTIRVLSIDPGVSEGRGDPNGISVVSFSSAEKKACIDECFEMTAKGLDLKHVIMNLIGQYPDIRTVVWEGNQGGDRLAALTLGHDFTEVTGVKVHMVHASQSKLVRAEELLTRYKARQIVHAKKHSTYERELMTFPHYLHSPNQTDSVAQAIDYISKIRI